MEPANFVGDCCAFARLYLQKTGKELPKYAVFDETFLDERLCEELIDEFETATDVTERIDCVIDAIYYILDHAAKVYHLREADVWKNMWLLNTGHDSKNLITQYRIFSKGNLQLKDDVSLEWLMPVYDMIRTSVDNNPTKYASILLELVSVLARLNFNITPLWKLVHCANMSKFEKGHLAEDGKKWLKPADFVAPDGAMRAEIERQRGERVLANRPTSA